VGIVEEYVSKGLIMDPSFLFELLKGFFQILWFEKIRPLKALQQVVETIL